MKNKNMIVLLILSSISVNAEDVLDDYIYLNNDYSHNEFDVVFSDNGLTTFYSGDLGKAYNKCKTGFNCIYYNDAIITVPISCALNKKKI